MEWDLLEKTSFWVNDINLNGAELDEVAEAAAKALCLKPGEVMVIDVRPGMVAFDILRRKVDAASVVGKQKEIFDCLSRVANVQVGENAGVHSEGVLGLIALSPEKVEEVLAKSNKMAEQIATAVSRRAIVFSSGSEVKEGKIKDTNSPYIMAALKEAGYVVQFGGVLDDDEVATAASLEEAVEQGFGLIISTGGVGAEDKDFAIEAIRRLDPRAYTPYILKFTPDNHRHYKDGVRIAVGKVGLALLVALPGPHEEAKISCISLLNGLKQGMEGFTLAEYIATVLRDRWRQAINK
jgi:molybdenum cofactor synthesis domain-containing protein